MALPDLVAQFSDETKCHAYLEGLRWPTGLICPGRKGEDGARAVCGSTKISRLAARHLFECVDCGYQFSTRVGTIFEDSKLPLWKWFVVVFMMAESKKGVSAKQIERMLAVSYKTAWYLCHRIREAMRVDGERQLTGTVEVDETFLGGKRRGFGSGFKGNKTVVMAAVERDGDVRLRMVPTRNRKEVRGFIDEHVSQDAAAVYTDEYQAYKGALKGRDSVHGRVKHSGFKKQWVHGKVHTNTVEGVFSLLDRSIIGAYHKVSKKHLPRYLDEVEWRYNNRRNPYLFRDTILELIGAQPLCYQKLISQEQGQAAS